MIENAKAPRRRCRLRLDLQADSVRDIQRGLRDMETKFALNDYSTRGCSGSPSVGWTYEFSEDETISHESYFEAVDRYLAELKKRDDGDVGDTSGQAGALS